MSRLQELKDKRAKVAADMRALHNAAEKEERGFSSDEDSKWNEMQKELDSLNARIERQERIEKEQGVIPSELRAAGKKATEGDSEAEARSAAFKKWLVTGYGDMTQEERSLLSRADMNRPELRAYTAGTANTGGVTVPEGFYAQLEVALKAFGGMLEVADIMRTDRGNDIPMPTFNNVAAVATIIGEGVQSSPDAGTPFGSLTMKAYTYRSPVLPISYEFMQDSSFGEGYIVNALGETIARGYNAHATNGTGSGQPQGIVTAATAGKVGATGQTTTIVVEDLIDLEHSIDPAYRKLGAQFMMHDQSFKVIKKLKDTTGRPLYLPGYDVGGPDTFRGYGVQINQDMPQMAANAKSIVFGALKKYKARVAKDVTVLRLVERYADYLQVGFLLFARMDGRLMDAGTNPVKFYQNSAS